MVRQYKEIDIQNIKIYHAPNFLTYSIPNMKHFCNRQYSPAELNAAIKEPVERLLYLENIYTNNIEALINQDHESVKQKQLTSGTSAARPTALPSTQQASLSFSDQYRQGARKPALIPAATATSTTTAKTSKEPVQNEESNCLVM